MTSPRSVRETVELHVDALYERDAAGRIAGVRGGGAPAPLFHLVRSVEGNRWLVGATLPPAARSTLEALAAAEPRPRALAEMEHGPPACRGAVLALLASVTPVGGEYRGPAYMFPEAPGLSSAVEVLGQPSDARPHAGLAWLAAFRDEDRPVVVARDATGTAVAVCHSARLGPASAEAGLEVAVAFRGRGLGVAVARGWATAVRAGGRVPLYSTSWENDASRGVARRLGLEAYAEDWHVD